MTTIHIEGAWKGQKIPVSISLQATIAELKSVLEDLTRVPSARIKLLGLCKGKTPLDAQTLDELRIPTGFAFVRQAVRLHGCILSLHHIVRYTRPLYHLTLVRSLKVRVLWYLYLR